MLYWYDGQVWLRHMSGSGEIRVEGFADLSGAMQPGVYALVWAGEVVYIGQSETPWARLYAHRMKWLRAREGKKVRGKAIAFSGFWVQPCAVSDLLRLEAELIVKYRPRYNLRVVIPAEVQKAELREVIAPLLARPKMESLSAVSEEVVSFRRRR